MNEIKLSEQPNVPDSAWKFVSRNEFQDIWEAEVTLPNGLKGVVRRKTYTEGPLLLAMNEEARKEASGRRYTHGLGSDKGGNMPMVQTASIPLQIYFAEIAERRRQGDRDHMRWWLSRPENQQWRTNTGQTRK